MQSSIKEHFNPMNRKKPFIKKGRTTNLSFVSKTNLQITKASNRFSLDKTFPYTDCKRSQIVNSSKQNTRDQKPLHQIPPNRYRAHKARPSLIKEKQNQFLLCRRKSLNKSQLLSHKQKLQQILQSIDLNTSMIQQLFECEEEIDFYKDEIKKTKTFYQNIHQQMGRQIITLKNRNQPFQTGKKGKWPRLNNKKLQFQGGINGKQAGLRKTDKQGQQSYLRLYSKVGQIVNNNICNDKTQQSYQAQYHILR